VRTRGLEFVSDSCSRQGQGNRDASGVGDDVGAESVGKAVAKGIRPDPLRGRAIPSGGTIRSAAAKGTRPDLSYRRPELSLGVVNKGTGEAHRQEP